MNPASDPPEPEAAPEAEPEAAPEAGPAPEAGHALRLAGREFAGQADFDERILPSLRALPFFRLASDAEIDGSLAAYREGDPAGLVTAWARIASPVRATLDGIQGILYRQAGRMPRRLLGLSFLSLTRGVLGAGRRIRAALRPDVQAAIADEFPWLEARHEHIPPGWVPAIDFPPAFADFLQGGTLDDARARWQLATALNEVQQGHSSRHLAALFRLPELVRHAEREEELAENYLAQWSPRVSRELWAQTLQVLDGLNAAVFASLSGMTGHGIRARALWGMVAGASEWAAFCAGLDRPQRLTPPPAPVPRR